jgi:Protein of unknown function (DUF2569)
MANEQNVACFADETIANPPWRIPGLQVARGGELRERIARTPEGFSSLLRPKLAAVPDDGRTNATTSDLSRQKIHPRTSNRGQWSLRVDLRSDGVTVMNQVKMHEMHDSAREPSGIGGWLLVLCLLLLIWRPVSSALAGSQALSLLSVRGPSLAVALAALTLVTAFGVAAGIALLARRGPAVRMAIAALLLSAALDLTIYTSPYFPSNRMPGDEFLYVAVSLIYHGAWLTYLFVSRRVRNTY